MRVFRTQLDLIMTIGGPAAQFFQQNRQRIFRRPNLVRGRRAADFFDAPATDAMVSVSDRCFRSQPDPEAGAGDNQVAVVIGNSPIEKRWLEEMRKLLPAADKPARDNLYR